MKKEYILIPLLLVILFLVLIIIQGYYQNKEEVAVSLDKTSYQKGEKLKVAIENNSLKNICFSSCYPYLLEKKDGEWKAYIYEDCQKDNVNEYCINPKEKKAFEIELPLVETGSHRISLPVCLDCKEGEAFQESAKFYSDEFTIK